MTYRSIPRSVRSLGMSLVTLSIAVLALAVVASPPALAEPVAPAPAAPADAVSAAQVSFVSVITIPRVAVSAALDGNCGADEYASARAVQYQELDGSGFPVLSPLRLQHDNTYLYVCLQGIAGSFSPNDFASVYLDYDYGREPLATYDDLSLTVNVQQYTTTLRGTGVPAGYVPSTLKGWDARSSFGAVHTFEYKIPVSALTLGGLCNRQFGLAVYHHWVHGVGIDYGWPGNQWWDQPQTWQPVQLDNVSCNPTLPVFAPLPVTVTQGTANGLGFLMQGIGKGTQNFSDTSHTGTPRFTVVNSDTGAFLEQYGAGGGFFALNPSLAFTVTAGGALDPGTIRQQTCGFLQGRSFFSGQALPEARPANCMAGPLPYQVTPIFAASLGASAQSVAQVADVVTTGMVVQVPLGVDTGGGNYLMLRGPGGHLSLVFNNTLVPGAAGAQAAPASLDGSFLGINALAVPYSRTLVTRGDYALHDSTVAVQRLQAIYPGAIVTPGAPELVYYAGDAAEDQPSLAPVWYFPSATALVDGHEVDLRGYSDTAIDGFVPSVAIIAPLDGSVFIVGRPLVVTATITGGAAPYTYTWLLDDGSSTTGHTQGGLITFITSTLPLPHPGDPPTVTVRLHVVDSIGAANQALLALRPGPVVYLPLVLRTFAAAQTVMVATSPVAPLSAVPQTAYWFGIEAGWDYPPYGPGGPDLGGVIPDANGFKSGMQGQGWFQRFYWANSSAWEKDWRDCGLGGADCSYGVDRADYVYYAGHGGGGGIAVPSSTHDSGWAAGSNMRFNVAKWVGFASCQTLRAQFTPAASAPIRSFFNSFAGGARMLLGFNSNMGDVAYGPRLVDNMRVPLMWGVVPMPWAQRTIAEAWVTTAFEMGAGKPAYMWITGNGQNPYYDRLPGPYTLPPSASPYPFGAWHWVWWDE